jgi:hypothetical protein
MCTGALIPTITIFSLTIIAKTDFFLDELTNGTSIFSLRMIKVTKIWCGHLIKFACFYELHAPHPCAFIELVF